MNREKKTILVTFLFVGGWMLVGLTIWDYLPWSDNVGIFMPWLFTFCLWIRFVYRQGVEQMKDEEEEKQRIEERQLLFIKKILSLQENREKNK